MKRFILRTDFIRYNAIELIKRLPLKPLYQITFKEVKSIRSLEQNAKMWAMLTDLSKQVIWYGMKLSPEDWKHMITAALKKYKVVPGIEGGFVVIGASTSKMSIREMIDVINYAYSFGDSPSNNPDVKGLPVKWSEPDPNIPEWVK